MKNRAPQIIISTLIIFSLIKTFGPEFGVDTHNFSPFVILLVSAIVAIKFVGILQLILAIVFLPFTILYKILGGNTQTKSNEKPVRRAPAPTPAPAENDYNDGEYSYEDRPEPIVPQVIVRRAVKTGRTRNISTGRKKRF